MIYIYTDGSCNNKTKAAGGIGFVIIHNKKVEEFYKGQYINSTSARMEITAIIEALKIVKSQYEDQEIILYSDNEYCVKTWMQKWCLKWEREDWQDRLNADLWQEFLRVVRSFRDPNAITLFHVKGHAGNKYNEVCDELARQGGKSLNIIKDKDDGNNEEELPIGFDNFHDLPF